MNGEAEAFPPPPCPLRVSAPFWFIAVVDAFWGTSVAAPVLHVASLWVFLVAASFVVVAAVVSSVPPWLLLLFLLTFWLQHVSLMGRGHIYRLSPSCKVVSVTAEGVLSCHFHSFCCYCCCCFFSLSSPLPSSLLGSLEIVLSRSFRGTPLT